jgi:hypothetical protein
LYSGFWHEFVLLNQEKGFGIDLDLSHLIALTTKKCWLTQGQFLFEVVHQKDNRPVHAGFQFLLAAQIFRNDSVVNFFDSNLISLISPFLQKLSDLLVKTIAQMKFFV